jgi:hypothetical protein
MRPLGFCTGCEHKLADDGVVEAECDLVRVFGVGRSRGRKPTLEDRLVARMLAPWLDREIADRVGTSLSEAYAARAEQLTGQRSRRAVARSLDRLAGRINDPGPGSRTVTGRLRREEVLKAMPVIVSIRACLCSTEPLNARGVARLKALLSNREGPCYVSSAPAELTAALREVSESLAVGY